MSSKIGLHTQWPATHATTSVHAPEVDLQALFGNSALQAFALARMTPEIPRAAVETIGGGFGAAFGNVARNTRELGEGTGKLFGNASAGLEQVGTDALHGLGESLGGVGQFVQWVSGPAEIGGALPEAHLQPTQANANPSARAVAALAAATSKGGNVLASGLQLEQQIDKLPARGTDGTPKGYHHKTPTKQEQANGAYNCTAYVTEVLKQAGYDVDTLVTVGGVTAPVSDFINIRAEAAAPEHLADGEAFVIVVPELVGNSHAAADLQNLVRSEDPRTKGVVEALVASEQGTEITNKNDLRPGDIIQGWRSDNRSGHATIVHRVHHRAGVLDEATAPSALSIQVTRVELLGAHYPIDENGKAIPKDANGVREGDSVYTKPATNLSEYPTWYAVRANGNGWPAPSVDADRRLS